MKNANGGGRSRLGHRTGPAPRCPSGPTGRSGCRWTRGGARETRSTRSGEQILELCNECHPFFTGKQKLVDSGGRVERFNRRYGERAAKK